MKKIGMAAFAALGVSVSASAADYTWQGASANWSASGNWKNGTTGTVGAWADGQTTIFPAGSPRLDVTVDKDVKPGQLLIKDSYNFSGSGNVEVNGTLHVDDKKTCVMDAKLMQTTAAEANRLVRGEEGTLVLQGGAELWRYQHTNGTTRVNGGDFKLTGASTGAGASKAAAAFTRGNFIVEGGATVSFDQTATFMPNSGAGIIVTNGTFDASKVSEVLNGFGDNNGIYNSKSAYIRVADAGTFVAPKIRIGKTTKAYFDANPEYARVFIDKGGTMKVREWSMDGGNTSYYAQIHFNGGLWDMITTSSDTGTQFCPFGNGKGRWDGVRLTVGKGGAYIKNEGKKNRKLTKAFDSGDENDGGVHILGDGLVYMNCTNTFNGGTWLDGALTYIPYNDSAFGAVPPAPTNNIFFTSSSMTLHGDYEMDVHPNRNVLISSNVTAQVGNGQKMRLKGTISTAGKDPSASVLKVVNNWTGSLALAPTDGRTNVLGRVYVNGHLIVEDGLTRITKDTGATAGENSALCIKGTLAKGYNANYGTLEVSGGTLHVTKYVYCFMNDYAQLKVNGGTFDVSGTHELLNAMESPSLVEVSDGGRIEAYIVRVCQTKDVAASYGADGLPLSRIHIATNGVLRLHHFNIDTNAKRVGRVDFDGGTLACRSSRDNLFGPGTGSWTGIQFRVCEGGAIVDTTNPNGKDGLSIDVLPPLVSGAAKDGGLRKVGLGTLTVKNENNTYNGPTRADNGVLKFNTAACFPGGDLEVSVAKVNRTAARTTPLIQAPTLAFKNGAKIRVVDAEADSAETFGKDIILARTETAMTNVPKEVVVVGKDGKEKRGPWAVTLSADGKTLKFGALRGLAIFVR